MFENKLVAIVNKQIETGIVMNALAHMSLGFGAHMGSQALHLMDYKTANGELYPHISKMPFIILREKNSQRIAALLSQAKERGLQFVAFTDTMTQGTWEDQAARTLASTSEEIIFYGLLLFGPQQIVSELTRKISLWKERL